MILTALPFCKEDEGQVKAADDSDSNSTATEDEIAQLEDVDDPELAEELALAVIKKLEARHQAKKFKNTYQHAKAYVKDIKKAETSLPRWKCNCLGKSQVREEG